MGDKRYLVPDLCNKIFVEFVKEKKKDIRNIELHADESVQSVDSTCVWKVIPR